MNAQFIDETTGTALPSALPARMLIAWPDDGSPAIVLGTLDYCQFKAHLTRAGYDPDHCAIGTAKFIGADFDLGWTQSAHVDALR